MNTASGSSVIPGGEYTSTYTGRLGVRKTGVYLHRTLREVQNRISDNQNRYP